MGAWFASFGPVGRFASAAASGGHFVVSSVVPFVDPLVVKGGPLLLTLCAFASCADRGSPRPTAILISLDTTRQDALGTWSTASTTPALDRLAAESIAFDAAYTVAPITLPSHASMLTGLYPPRHSLRDNGLWALPQDARTLAEEARAGGLQTAAFLGAVVLDRGFGLDQGFDVYDVPARSAAASSHASERTAAEVVDAALAWLAGRDPDRGAFLWLHLFDPHAPYTPPPDLRAGAFAGNPYRAEVTAMDRELGRFFDALREEGLFDTSTLLVVADHGEGLGEHGEATHGTHVFESTLRVPLLLRPPGGVAARRVATPVSVVDVFPTLLESLGLALPGDVDGESLLAPRAERGVYFESYSGYLSFGWSPIAGWLDARGKYVHSSQPEFFEVRSDPGEADDRLAAIDPKPYRLAIAAVCDAPRLGGDEADAELLSELRGLGYAAVGGTTSELPHPLAPSDRPAPRATIAEHADFLRAMQLTNAGQASEAEELLRSILGANPHNAFASDLLAFNLNALGRTEDAVVVLQELLRDGRPWPNSWHNLGLCLQKLGRLEDALAALERAVELAPSDPKNVRALAELRRLLGQAR